MEEYVVQNQKAWNYNTYAFWVKQNGTPAEQAMEIRKNPIKKLRKYGAYFDTYKGIRVANICGSCGKKAVSLAMLEAEVTVFDISQENQRYALEMAEAAGVPLDYVVGDVLKIDLKKYSGYFDVVFMEGGILHYFHDIKQFMDMMYALLKSGGKMICSDFHPFGKVVEILGVQQPDGDYFSTEVFEGEMAHARFYKEDIREQIPKCSYRKYTISEIINGAIDSGFVLNRFDEHPGWTNSRMPGEFTMIAVRN